MALPYIKGGQSGVLAQASALLLPVVTSDLKSFKDWISNVKGGFYAKTDEDYITHITNLLQDDDLRMDFQNNIRQNNKKLYWTEIASKHINFYSKLITPPIKGADFLLS